MDELIHQRAFSTIELMIAMTIMVMVMSAVVVVSFGNQTFLSNSQTSSEAMIKAQGLLEKEQALGRKDFDLVNPIASTTDGLYDEAVYVDLQGDWLTKQVTAHVEWTDERKLLHDLALTTLIANFDTPVGENTCSSALSGDWHAPVIEKTINFSSFAGIPAGTYTLSDVDAYQGKLYVTASNTSAPALPTLFIFDISDMTNPILLSSIDNEVFGGTQAAGLSAVRVAQDPASSPLKTYAFVAAAPSSDFATCDPKVSKSCAQFDVFDVSTPAAPTLSSNLMIASSTAPFVTGSGIQARGNSIFYKNGYVLLGLTKTGTGPEFHLIDVHNPTSLFNAQHLLYPIGSFAVGHDINAISMRNTYAILATPVDVSYTKELQILNMTNPSTPVLAGSFDSISGAGNGKSMYLVGDYLYLGKTVPNAGNDVHVLNVSDLNITLPEVGGFDLPQSANAIIVRDYLSFILTNTDLRIYRTDNLSSVSSWATLSLPSSGSATEPSMDCESNRMYITSNDATGHGSLYIVKPS